jgi:hypothetical protein
VWLSKQRPASTGFILRLWSQHARTRALICGEAGFHKRRSVVLLQIMFLGSPGFSRLDLRLIEAHEQLRVPRK